MPAENMPNDQIQETIERGDGVLDQVETAALSSITTRAKERIDQNKDISFNKTNKVEGDTESSREQLATLFETHLSMKFEDKKSLETKNRIEEGLDWLLYDFTYDLLKNSNDNKYDLVTYREKLQMGYYLLRLDKPDQYKQIENDVWAIEIALRYEFSKTKAFIDNIRIGDKTITGEEYEQNWSSYLADWWKVKERTFHTETPPEMTQELLSYQKKYDQFFYRADARPDDVKTKEFVGNNLKDIQRIAQEIQNNPEIDQSSVKLVISSSASNIRYSWEYKNNEWLAAGRGINLKNTIDQNRTLSSKPDYKMESSVNGPEYPPTDDMLKQYFPDGSININNWFAPENFTTVEEKIYRQYQNVSVKFDFQLKDKKNETVVLEKESPLTSEIDEQDKRPAAEIVVDLWWGKLQLLQLGNSNKREFTPITPTTYNFKLWKQTTSVNEMATNTNEVVSQTPAINITPYQYILIQNLLTPGTYTKVEQKYYFNKIVEYKDNPKEMEKFLITENKTKKEYYQTNKQKIPYTIQSFKEFPITPEEAETLKNMF